VHKPFRTTLSWTVPLVFVLFYAFWPFLDLPQPYYAPQLRAILWSKPQGVMTQGWYGRVLMVGVISMVLGTLAAWGISRRTHPSWSRFGPWLAAAGALAAMIITALYEIRRWML